MVFRIRISFIRIRIQVFYQYGSGYRLLFTSSISLAGSGSETLVWYLSKNIERIRIRNQSADPDPGKRCGSGYKSGSEMLLFFLTKHLYFFLFYLCIFCGEVVSAYCIYICTSMRKCITIITYNLLHARVSFYE